MNIRFKLATLFLVLAFAANAVLTRDLTLFSNINYGLEFAVWTWFFWDHRLLKEKYFHALLFSIAILIYGYFIDMHSLSSGINDPLKHTVFLPLLLLIIQRPLRLLFISITGQEPIVELWPEKIENKFYMAVLFLSGGLFIILTH